jgi:hypothetical protein
LYKLLSHKSRKFFFFFFFFFYIILSYCDRYDDIGNKCIQNCLNLNFFWQKFFYYFFTTNMTLMLNNSSWVIWKYFLKVLFKIFLYKRTCQTKNEPYQQGISYLEREREGGEREAGRRIISKQAYLRFVHVWHW